MLIRRRSRLRAGGALVVTLLCGCAAPGPNDPPRAVSRMDKMLCSSAAHRATEMRGPPGMRSADSFDIYQRCMKSRAAPIEFTVNAVGKTANGI
jgi:hypothetical protein